MSNYAPRMSGYAPQVRSYDNSTSFSDDAVVDPTTIPSVDLDLEPAKMGFFEQNKVAALGVIVFSIIIVFYVSNAYYSRTQTSGSNNGTNGDIEAGDDNENSPAAKIFAMSSEERMTLYNEAFDRNKNQIVMEASSILKGNPEDPTLQDSDNSDHEEDDDRSIYLALKDARAMRRASGKRVSLTGKRDRRRSSIIHPRTSITAATADIESAALKDDIVRGNCVICFEDIEAGDVVVWSETKSCPHVYHKDCMVAYLAHKKQSIKEIELDENPCPTCRQKFVTVCTPCTTAAEDKDNENRTSSRTSATSTDVESARTATSPEDSAPPATTTTTD